MEASHQGGNDQVEGARFVAQVGLVGPIFSPYEPHGTDEQLTIQSTAVNQGYRTTSPKKRPSSSCPYCPSGKDFGRFQELKRHVRDVHVRPSSCPFCDFTWTRPYKIKDHIISNHGDAFTAEFLIKFRAFSGRQVTEFLGEDD